MLSVTTPYAMPSAATQAVFGELGSIEHEARSTSHWVAAYPSGGHVPSLGEGGPCLSLGEGESVVTTTFCATC